MKNSRIYRLRTMSMGVPGCKTQLVRVTMCTATSRSKSVELAVGLTLTMPILIHSLPKSIATVAMPASTPRSRHSERQHGTCCRDCWKLTHGRQIQGQQGGNGRHRNDSHATVGTGPDAQELDLKYEKKKAVQRRDNSSHVRAALTSPLPAPNSEPNIVRKIISKEFENL